MKNILVPVGSSKNSVSNLQYAIDLAEHIDGNVYVISVFKDLSKAGSLSRLNTFLKEEAEDRLEKVLSKVNKKQVSVVASPIQGKILDGINRINKQIPMDLMVLSPRSNSIKEEVYLGKTSGKLLKQTNIPILIVPEGVKFKEPKTMLMAFKNGTFEHESLLEPVIKFVKNFGTEVHVLHVETPETTDEMKKVTENLKAIQNTYTQVEAASTFQGLIEYFQHFNPDMLCVVRRKRGFFKKLWEKNEIYKKEFYTSKPLLVLPVQD